MAKTNYIRILNSFWRWRKVNELNHSEADLYFAILDCFNSSGWKKSLTIPNSTLISQTKSSKSQFIRTREKLIEKSLIKYTKGKIQHAGSYELLPLFDFDYDTSYGTSYDTSYGTSYDTSYDTIYKKNNNINNNIYNGLYLGQPTHLFKDDYNHKLLEELTRK